MQSRDPCIHRCPDGETRGGFMLCAVGQHGNGINKKMNRGRDGGRHGCDYLSHQISTAMRASGGDHGFLLKKRATIGKSASSQGGRVGGRGAPSAATSHLDGAGRQESVGTNKGGREVGWVKSDAAVGKKKKRV